MPKRYGLEFESQNFENLPNLNDTTPNHIEAMDQTRQFLLEYGVQPTERIVSNGGWITPYRSDCEQCYRVPVENNNPSSTKTLDISFISEEYDGTSLIKIHTGKPDGVVDGIHYMQKVSPDPNEPSRPSRYIICSFSAEQIEEQLINGLTIPAK